MITVVIKPGSWHWRSPAFIKRLADHCAEEIDVSVWQDPPKPKLNAVNLVENQIDIDRYDQGFRQFQYGAELTIRLDVLTHYLPCEVTAIHGHVDIHTVEQRVAPVHNTKVKVVVPGPALQEYDEVSVEVDCCTDHLQNLLNDRWRILAICVQPDQRRPDYILGRKYLEIEDIRRLTPPTLPFPTKDHVRPMPTSTPPDTAPAEPTPETKAEAEVDIPF